MLDSVLLLAERTVHSPLFACEVLEQMFRQNAGQKQAEVSGRSGV